MTGPAEFELVVITHDRIVFHGPAVSLIVPGVSGSIGIMAHHAPMVASLGRGTVTVYAADGSDDSWEINLGLIEVSDNGASVLVEEISGDRGTGIPPGRG
jgi:F-type H+-transporting ATPase subunit epsilon